MSEIPGDANEADVVEQRLELEDDDLVETPDPGSTPFEADEADALEQQLSARPGESGSPVRPVGDREANEADVLEQEIDVPLDDDDALT